MKKFAIYFGADWCMPCKQLKPIVQQVAQQTGAQVQYIDIDSSPDLVSKYSITSVPTIIVVDSSTGNIIQRRSGMTDLSSLRSMLG
jgi:thioredoxin-like negative regulator of GroEL